LWCPYLLYADEYYLTYAMIGLSVMEAFFYQTERKNEKNKPPE
jgi:hypothetical protein